MVQHARIEANNEEIELLEPLIQHIQSFMDGKEAARTTILSKAWHRAWLTCPYLSFHQGDFQNFRGPYPNYQLNNTWFWNTINETLQRYNELNLEIEGFTLRVNRSPLIASLGSEVITTIMKMGVHVVDFECLMWWARYILPFEVFKTETLTKLSVSGWKICVPQERKANCPRLRLLYLSGVRLRDDFFSLSFPCLENLTLEACRGCKVGQISYRMLKTLSLINMSKVKAKFELPGIKKFKFLGSRLPSIWFTNVSGEWESDITIDRCDPISRQSWFYELRRFLKKLSSSKVNLIVNFESDFYTHDGELQGKHGPVVENLTISVRSLWCWHDDHLDGLFWCCHPKFIIQHWFPPPCTQDRENVNNHLVEFINNRLKYIKDGSISQNAGMFVYDDLQSISFQGFHSTRRVWWPLEIDSFDESKQIYFLCLEWR